MQTTKPKLFFRFASVGVAGFFFDAGILTALLSIGADFYSGRVVSFLCAVTLTWYLNRTYTFCSKDSRLLLEWGRFVSANAVGGLINYLVYAVLVTGFELFAAHPVGAVGAGSAAGLLWNFTASRHLVFDKRQIGNS